MKRKRDKCKLTLKFDLHGNYRFLGAGDDHCLAAQRLPFQEEGYEAPVTILDAELGQNQPAVVFPECAYIGLHACAAVRWGKLFVM